MTTQGKGIPMNKRQWMAQWNHWWITLACAWALSIIAVPSTAWAQEMPTSGQVGITPEKFIIDLDEGPRIHAYRLINMGSKPIRVAVDVTSFDMDEKNRLVRVPPDETALENWVVINPLEVEIPPNDSRVVRFSIRPAMELPEGEYRMAMQFRQMRLPEADTGHDLDEDASGLVFRSRFNIRSAIYATVGSIERTGRVLDHRLEADTLWLKVRNTGNGHIRLAGNWALWSRDGSGNARTEPPLYQGRLAARPVMPGDTRWLPVPLGESIAPGDYRIRLDARIGDQEIRDGDIGHGTVESGSS